LAAQLRVDVRILESSFANRIRRWIAIHCHMWSERSGHAEQFA
jgi:hypothetical protein